LGSGATDVGVGVGGLALEGIDKRFGDVHAVRDVSLSFSAGRIHAVVGENGAGKSTLLRIAAGLLAPDRGTVRVCGSPLRRASARDALALGVAMVQQQFALASALTALENFMLGAEPAGSFGRLDRSAAQAKAERAARDLGVDLPWSVPVERLSMGERQRLEIVRAIARDARVLILDEPTSVLTPGEAAGLYTVLARLASPERTIVVVTHRLDEVRAYADTVSVLRHGRLVATRPIRGRDDAEMRALTDDVMGADAPPPLARPPPPATGEARIELRDVTSDAGLHGLTLSVLAGEIVGVAGVDGNGQDALVRVLAGLESASGGVVRADAVEVVHADRDRDGLVGDAPVRDNLLLGEFSRFARRGFVSRRALEREADARLRRGGVVPPDLDAPVRTLSGGNRQKVVVARAMARADRAGAFVFAQPTQGVDAGAARQIHADIAHAAQMGKAVLIVSTDLAELRRLSHRIAVIVRGRIAVELPPDAPEGRFGDAMLGGGG
jgi:simple sugar transport system ATP-binding protein